MVTTSHPFWVWHPKSPFFKKRVTLFLVWMDMCFAFMTFKNFHFKVIWDYHVIFIYKPDERCIVFDMDSELPFPTFFRKYVTETFRTDAILNPGIDLNKTKLFYRCFKFPFYSRISSFFSCHSFTRFSFDLLIRPSPYEKTWWNLDKDTPRISSHCDARIIAQFSEFLHYFGSL